MTNEQNRDKVGRYARDTSGKNAMPDSTPLPRSSTEPEPNIHELANMWSNYVERVPRSITDPNVIANWIREIDGNHSMGAGELGEELADRIEKEIHRQAILNELGDPSEPTPEDYAVQAYLSSDAYAKFWAERQSVAGRNEKGTSTAGRINSVLNSFQKNIPPRTLAATTPREAVAEALADASTVAQATRDDDTEELIRATSVEDVIEGNEYHFNRGDYTVRKAYEYGLQYAETLALKRIPYPEVTDEELYNVVEARLNRGSVKATSFYGELERLGVKRIQVARIVTQEIADGRILLSPDNYLSFRD